MRLAILDLGTNTFHLLIADVHPDQSFEIVFKTRSVVKLGQGGISKNQIADQPFRRGINTIIHFKELAESYQAKKFFAFATSAIRSSKNGREFAVKVKNETGIEIRIIPGDVEAQLIYYGVRQCVEIGEEPALIMDIGGGSTEFIIADHQTIFWKQSFDIGAARLLEQFNPSDPIQDKEVIHLEKYLDNILKPLQEAVQRFPVRKLIGSSGSFDTLAEMIGFLVYRWNVIKGKLNYTFNLEEFDLIHAIILTSTTAERMKMKGLVRMRVDMIVLSSICTNYILRKFNITEMILSKYALKEGALWELAKGVQSI